MKILHDLTALDPALRSGAVTIGNFDGVHQGHARIIARLRKLAERVGGPAIVFTFDPHPVRLLRPTETPPPLTWTDRKAELLTELGIDAMVAYPTDEALLRLSPTEFFDRIVRRHLDAQAMVEGPNFHFGRQRAGNIDVLGELTQAAGMLLEVVEPLIVDGEIVSSSACETGCMREPWRKRGGCSRLLTVCAAWWCMEPAGRQDRFSDRESGRHRHLAAGGRRLCGTCFYSWSSVAGCHQYRHKSYVWRARFESGSPRDRLARPVISPAAGD